MKYIICGFSGAGKSTKLNQLRNLEKYAQYQFVDLDDYIFDLERTTQKNLAQLIEDKSWKWFRAREAATLLELVNRSNIWIALGGGTLNDHLCQELEKHKDLKIYWLNTAFELCWSRIEHDTTRPLTALGKESMLELYEKRCLLYKKYPPMTF